MIAESAGDHMRYVDTFRIPSGLLVLDLVTARCAPTGKTKGGFFSSHGTTHLTTVSKTESTSSSMLCRTGLGLHPSENKK